MLLYIEEHFKEENYVQNLKWCEKVPGGWSQSKSALNQSKDILFFLGWPLLCSCHNLHRPV